MKRDEIFRSAASGEKGDLKASKTGNLSPGENSVWRIEKKSDSTPFHLLREFIT